jgi:O6-methylguanine-DNA--protein-cysteine methyltransferase
MADLSFRAAAEAAQLQRNPRRREKLHGRVQDLQNYFAAQRAAIRLSHYDVHAFAASVLPELLRFSRGRRVTAEGRAVRLYAQAHGAAKRLRPKGDDPSRIVLWPQTRPSA